MIDCKTLRSDWILVLSIVGFICLILYALLVLVVYGFTLYAFFSMVLLAGILIICLYILLQENRMLA